jgi:rRNA processing protein Gar1
MSQIIGHISQVIGPVVDVYFEGTESDLILPSIRIRDKKAQRQKADCRSSTTHW